MYFFQLWLFDKIQLWKQIIFHLKSKHNEIAVSFNKTNVSAQLLFCLSSYIFITRLKKQENYN